jgi:hypothetical protein
MIAANDKTLFMAGLLPNSVMSEVSGTSELTVASELSQSQAYVAASIFQHRETSRSAGEFAALSVGPETERPPDEAIKTPGPFHRWNGPGQQVVIDVGVANLSP